MLVPLLARPVADPLANLLFQDFLSIFAGLLSSMLLSRFALRDASNPAVGLITAASTLALAPPGYQAMYLINACYGVWLALGLGGLILAERPSPARLALAGVLILLARWVNFTTSLVLGPLVVARALWPGRGLPGRRRLAEALIALALLGLGVTVGGWLTTLPRVKVPTSLDALPAHRWPEAWLGLWSRHQAALTPGRLPAFVAAAAGLGLAALSIPATRRRARPVWSAALSLAAAAAVVWLCSGTRLWVRLNGYAYIYINQYLMMIQTAAVGVVLGPIGLSIGSRGRRGLAGLAAAGLLGGGAWTFGPPSISGVRADFDRQFGALTPDLLEARCTHLAGSYDRVWPAVFHAWVVLHGRGERRVVWAVAGRGEATVDRWRPPPGGPALVAVPHGDDDAALDALNEFAFPSLGPDHRRATVNVYRIASISRGGPESP